MNDDRWEKQGLRWTQDYMNGEIGTPEFAQLEQLLLASPPARSEFRRYARTDVALRELAEGVDEVFAPEAGGRRPAREVGRRMQLAAMVTMAVALVFLLTERLNTAPDSPRLVQGQDFEEGAIAVLTHAVGVKWDGDLAYAEGAALRPNMLKIAKGLLQIEFFSGATVVVEGPAEFELVDPMHARCSLGRVRANVPHFASGFTIDSSELRVVDIGTEFGFSAEADGVRELHVFDGEVKVNGGVVGVEPRHLLTGNAIRVAGGAFEHIPAVPEAFADAEQISSLASAAAAEQRKQWNRYAEDLKANSDVLLYYSFDNHVAWSRRLSNDKKMVADPLYGAIVGCRWAEGRWRGKAALEFKRQSDRVRISIPGVHDELTLMTWVRIDGFDRKLNSLMLSDGWDAGSIHWQISHEGAMILGVKGQGSAQGHYESEPVFGQRQLGEWLHLAVSYGGPRGEVVQFVNGRPIWQGPVVQHHAIVAPRGELGNWSPGNRASGSDDADINIRNLNGRMDEFLVFSAALDPAGVKAIFEKGRPR